MQILANGLVAGATYTLVGLGFAIIFQTTRVFDFSFAATLTLSAYLAASVADLVNLPVLLVLLTGAFVAAGAGAAFDYLVYRQLRHRDASSLMALLSALGLMIATANLVALVFGDSPRLLRGTTDVRSVALLSARLAPLQIATIVAAIAAATGCWWVFSHTRWGLTIRAVTSDDNLARCVGVRTDHAILQAMVFASALGGLAGTLVGLDTGLTPEMGLRLLLPAVVGAIIGGVGRISGVLLGGFTVGIVQQFSGWFFSTAWQDTIVFVVLILFLLLRPQGFLGRPIRRATV